MIEVPQRPPKACAASSDIGQCSLANSLDRPPRSDRRVAPAPRRNCCARDMHRPAPPIPPFRIHVFSQQPLLFQSALHLFRSRSRSSPGRQPLSHPDKVSDDSRSSTSQAQPPGWNGGRSWLKRPQPTSFGYVLRLAECSPLFDSCSKKIRGTKEYWRAAIRSPNPSGTVPRSSPITHAPVPLAFKRQESRSYPPSDIAHTSHPAAFATPVSNTDVAAP